MNTRKIGAAIFVTATLIVVGFTIYKIIVGKDVGFNEVIAIGALLMTFFFYYHLGNKRRERRNITRGRAWTKNYREECKS